MTDLAAWTDPIADEEYTFMVHDGGEDLPMIWSDARALYPEGTAIAYTFMSRWPKGRPQFYSAANAVDLYDQLIEAAKIAHDECVPEHRDRFTALQRCLRIARRNAERATV